MRIVLYYLFAISPMLLFGSIGVVMTINGNLMGIIPIILATMVAPRLKELPESPRTVGLISFFSQKTDVKVEGTVVLLKILGINVIDVVEISMQKKDLSYDIPQVTANDQSVLSGKIEISIIPNEDLGELLKMYDDAGRDTGIRNLSEGIVNSLVQEICAQNSPDQCVTDSAGLGRILKKRLEGYNLDGTTDNDSSDDITAFGIKIITCTFKLQKDKSVVQADQDSRITKIMNGRIKVRREFYQEEISRIKKLKEEGENVVVPKLPSDQVIRRELLEEDRNTRGDIKEVRGGTNITTSDFKDRGGK